MRWGALGLLGLLIACSPAHSVDAPEANTPVFVHQTTDLVLPAEPEVPSTGPRICTRAVDLIVAFEIGSPEVYQAKYRHPIWPGAASGVTVGIGYDLGYQLRSIIIVDWASHPHAARLASVAGITGPLAREEVRQLADITIEYGHARQVFDQTSVVIHHNVARRVFRPENFDRLPCGARGALLSLVFNRGGSMTGPARTEMRHIRDICLPAQDTACIADQLRAMVRIWAGSSIENGMKRRRFAEAELAMSEP